MRKVNFISRALMVLFRRAMWKKRASAHADYGRIAVGHRANKDYTRAALTKEERDTLATLCRKIVANRD